jgi:hypothetical protein
LADSDLSSVESETFDVDVVVVEAFEAVREVFADFVEVLEEATEPFDRPPIEVSLRTDLKERDDVSEVVDADRVEGGTGADGLGGNETEGESLRDFEVVDAE